MKQAVGFGLFIVVFTMIFNPPEIGLPTRSEQSDTESSHIEEPNYRSVKPTKQVVQPVPKTNSATQSVQTEKYIQLSRVYECAAHESAHYIIYMKNMELIDATPRPIEISIIPQVKNDGHFTADGYGDLATEILVDYAGYASRIVFFGESEKKVFDEMKEYKYSDFKHARKIRGDRTISEFDDFRAAVQWVRKYRNEIATFAIRLQKEKFIKF